MPPPSILYLAGVLDAHRIEVRILDLNVTRAKKTDDQKAIASVCSEFDPELIGIGCLFSGQFPSVLDIAHQVKQLTDDKAKIIVGGIHPTIFHSEILENVPEIDYVALGEGEPQLLALATGWMPFSEGLAWRSKGTIQVNPKAKLSSYITQLDNLPFPAYHLIDLDDYSQDLSHWHNPKGLEFSVNIPILSSRSCPRSCNFCSMHLVMGKGIRFRSPADVVDEIEWLYREYECNRFAFQDDNLTLSKSHIEGICHEILHRELDIQWEPNNGLMVKTLTSDIIDLMVESGMIRAFLAIESGNGYIRNRVMGKDLDKEDIYRVAFYLKEKHPQVFVRGLFIMGMPEDTPETLDDTYDMIKELPLDTFSISNIMPFPGTEVFNQAVKDDILINTTTTDMWKESRMDYNDNKTFYIKPYDMTEEQLHEYRQKFDELKATYK